MIKSFITTKIYEPLYYKFYRKDDTLKFYKLYKKEQWNSLENNKKIQAQQLYKLIKYATETIPYYKKLIQKNKIQISEKTIFDDIKKFPILTKDIIRKEFNNIHKKNKTGWYYNTSGGSTGEPIKLIQDKHYWETSYAMTRLQYEWVNYRFGETQIKLWGSERDILKEKEHLKSKFANWIRSTYILNSFLMNEQMMKSHIEFINKKKPKLILAYVQSIYELSKFIKTNNIKTYTPNAIMTSAGTLYPENRKIITDAFKCPVFDRYGSREVGGIACECEKHTGLHISAFTHYVEVLNKKLEPCKEGEIGEIYITLLTNYTMPLIRYKIEDMGQYTNKKCECGRGLPLLKQIIGRNNSMIKTKKGTFDSVAISALLYFYKDKIPFQSFSKYQIIQENYKSIHFKIIIADEKLWELEKKRIEEKFAAVLGSDIKIIFEKVKTISPLKSGKYTYIINRIK